MEKYLAKRRTNAAELRDGRYGSLVTESDSSIQIGADDDTQPGVHCARCAARANVDAALVRAGTLQVTLVGKYERTRFGTCATEDVRAFINLGPDTIVRGEGHSREEAIVDALSKAGVHL